MDDVSGAEGIDRCDFCRLPLPNPPVMGEYGGETYEFCCGACEAAMSETDRVFTEHHGFKRLQPGVSALDASLPQGLPRNSFVLLSGEQGTRDGAVHAELMWRTLERGEPVVVMTFQEPPISIVERFLTLEWNVLPYLESGQLHVIDCFTYRVGDRDRMFDRMNDWNKHIHRISRNATTTVRDPTDMDELQNKVDNCLEALDMVDTGILLIDSLTELGTLVQPVQAYNFVKDVRADICKGRFVPVFAGATYVGDEAAFPHDLGYVMDGIVDMELNAGIVRNTLIKRIRIRKMSGVLTIPEWTAYEYTSRLGLVMFDPEEEMEAAADEAETESESGDGRNPAADGRSRRRGSGASEGGSGSPAAEHGG